MDPYFPDLRNYKEYREPFLGGGSVAIHIAKKYPSLDIWVNDLYNPLYTFWCILRDKPQDLYECIKETKAEHNTPELARKLFEESKVSLNHEETWDFYRAVAFYIINKCSFSGLTENSSFSPQASESNFSMRGIEKLPEYSKIIKDWKITNLSYEKLLTDDKECFIYLDPPYEIGSNLYGKRGSMHKSFDHDQFALDCDRYTAPQLISYNSSQLIRDRFKDWDASEFDLTYTMRSVGDYMREQKDRKELILFNYEMSSKVV